VTPDQAIQRVEEFRRDFPQYPQPSATVILSTEFLAAVEHMAAKMPPTDQLAWPEEEDVRWAWAEGVNFVFEREVTVENLIVSKDGLYGERVAVTPHIEVDVMAGMVFGAKREKPSFIQMEDKRMPGPVLKAQATVTMPVDPNAGASSGYVHFGRQLNAHAGFQIAGMASFEYALVTLLGLPVARVAGPGAIGRAGYRRIERSGQTVRRVDLISSSSSDGEGRPVDWEHSWWVRGHWRNQVCGPQQSLRKLIWIDPHVKGFGPMDERPTVWVR
jgi:hypothetical protein